MASQQIHGEANNEAPMIHGLLLISVHWSLGTFDPRSFSTAASNNP
jgi:hypothetical protein